MYSLTTECVLLLQNVFSYDKVCSGTAPHVWAMLCHFYDFAERRPYSPYVVYLQYLQAGILLLLASYTCRQAYYYYLHARAKVALDQHQTCCCFLFLTMQGTRTCQTTHTFSLHIQDSHTYDRL